MKNDKAEVDRLNAQIGALQLARIREALGCDELELLEIINNHPEQLKKLKQDNVVGDTDKVLDDAEMLGQTSFFGEKSKPYNN